MIIFDNHILTFKKTTMFLSIMKFLLKGKVRKALKTMADDPEVISAIQGIEYHEKELEKQAKDFEKKYGKHPRGENRVKPKF